MRKKEKRKRRFAVKMMVMGMAVFSGLFGGRWMKAGALGTEGADPGTDKISVSLKGEGESPENISGKKFFKDSVDVIITVREKEFDYRKFSVTVEDESGRTAKITCGEQGENWEGLEQLGEETVEAVPFWKDPETRMDRMCLRFKKEGSYKVKEISCEDMAGNRSLVKDAAEFAVDRTAPLLEVKLPENEKPAHEGYYHKLVTVWFYLKEHNFTMENGGQSPRIFVKKGSEGEAEQEESQMTWKAAPEKGKDWYKAAVFFEGDAAYTLRADYRDPAGWEISEEEKKVHTFTVDVTPPEFGRVTIMGKSWETLLQYVTFGMFSMKTEPVFLEGSDCVSPVEPLKYYCSERVLTKEELESLEEKDWKQGETLSLTPEAKVIVYLKVTNYAGLSRYYCSEGILLEEKGPFISLKAEGDRSVESGIYRGGVTVKISLREPGEEGKNSGIRSAGYRLIKKAEAGAEDSDGDVVTAEGQLCEFEEAMAQTGWEGQVMISAAEYEERTAELLVWAEDFSGNHTEKKEEYSIDGTAPEITVKYNDLQPVNERYYNQIRVGTVTIREKNFVPEKTEFLITNTDGAMPQIGEWSHEGIIHRCTVEFSSDGDYTFSLNCEDLAGNRSREDGGEFTIDRTAPEIQIEFEETEAGRGEFYRTARKARITVKEHNFQAGGVCGTVRVLPEDSSGEGKFRELKGGDFTGNGDSYVSELVFEKDGRYRLEAGCEDLAGNRQAGERKGEEFVIDRTKPEIQVAGVEDQSANRGTTETTIILRDSYLDAEGCSVGLFFMESGKSIFGKEVKKISGKRSPGKNQEQQFFLEDLPHDPGRDGVYLMNISGCDEAGNRTVKNIRFSVNRYGSVYLAGEETAGWLYPEDGGFPYLKEERELVIREYNVDPVEEHRLLVGCDGEIRTLREGEDYIRTEEQGKTGLEIGKLGKIGREGSRRWRSCEYRIRKENFKKEGSYEVVLYSEDAAGNRMGSSSAKSESREARFCFSVDKTGPTVSLAGAVDGGRYKKRELDVMFTVMDNMAVERVEVSIGGERKTYEGERLKNESGGNRTVPVTIGEADGWQVIGIRARDRAGNPIGASAENGGTEETPEWKILVSSSGFVHFYRNPKKMAGLFSTAFVGTMVAFILIRRKNQEKKRGGRKGKVRRKR